MGKETPWAGDAERHHRLEFVGMTLVQVEFHGPPRGPKSRKFSTQDLNRLKIDEKKQEDQ
jgi:hypothetical protein